MTIYVQEALRRLQQMVNAQGRRRPRQATSTQGIEDGHEFWRMWNKGFDFTEPPDTGGPLNPTPLEFRVNPSIVYTQLAQGETLTRSLHNLIGADGTVTVNVTQATLSTGTLVVTPTHYHDEQVTYNLTASADAELGVAIVVVDYTRGDGFTATVTLHIDIRVGRQGSVMTSVVPNPFTFASSTFAGSANIAEVTITATGGFEVSIIKSNLATELGINVLEIPTDSDTTRTYILSMPAHTEVEVNNEELIRFTNVANHNDVVWLKGTISLVDTGATAPDPTNPSLPDGVLSGVVVITPLVGFWFGVVNAVRANGAMGLEIGGTYLYNSVDKVGTRPWSDTWMRSAEYAITDDGVVTAGAGANIGSTTTTVSQFVNSTGFVNAATDAKNMEWRSYEQTWSWDKTLFYPTPNSEYLILIDQFAFWMGPQNVQLDVSLEFSCRVRHARYDPNTGGLTDYTDFGRRFVKLHVDKYSGDSWDNPTGQGFETYS